MSFKSLTTIVTSEAETQQVTAGAAQLARLFDAHLDVLALGVDRTQVGYAYLGGGGVLMHLALEQAEAQARATETAAKAALEAEAPGLRWAVEGAVAQSGVVGELVALRARFADLVVLPRPYGPGRPTDAEAVAEAALFEGQAPVLVLPDGKPLTRLPERIVIGWNQSREAMVAVRRALPLLKAARRVEIAVIDPPHHGPERSDPGGMLCQMLVRHGVKAEVAVLARSMPRISDVLNRHLRDMDAEMLVMGAYGHSRFREAILGGATRNMLEQAEVPVFMAH